jgi:hypothetical protein
MISRDVFMLWILPAKKTQVKRGFRLQAARLSRNVASSPRETTMLGTPRPTQTLYTLAIQSDDGDWRAISGTSPAKVAEDALELLAHVKTIGDSREYTAPADAQGRRMMADQPQKTEPIARAIAARWIGEHGVEFDGDRLVPVFPATHPYSDAAAEWISGVLEDCAGLSREGDEVTDAEHYAQERWATR